MEEDRISNLPLELKANILSRLSTKHIFYIKCLFKSWKAEIRSSDFINEYLHCQARHCNSNSSSSLFILIGRKSSFYSYDFDVGFCKKLSPPPRDFVTIFNQTKLVGSCNGLLCFQGAKKLIVSFRFVSKEKLIVSFQGETGTYMRLPPFIPTKDLSASKSLTYFEKIDAGFGYDYIYEDYKLFALVLVTVLNLEFEKFIEDHMYSLKSNSWKKINNLPSLRWNEDMISCKNALHWLTYAEDQTTVVAAFNFGIEEHYTLQLPKEGTFSMCHTNLVALKGYLHVDFTPPDMSRRIWVMKEYGVTKSWTPLVQFTIPLSNKESWRFQPLPCSYSKDGKQVLVALEAHPKFFVNFNVQSGKVKGPIWLDSQILRDVIAVVPEAGSVVRDPLVPTTMMKVTRMFF